MVKMADMFFVFFRKSTKQKQRQKDEIEETIWKPGNEDPIQVTPQKKEHFLWENRDTFTEWPFYLRG